MSKKKTFNVRMKSNPVFDVIIENFSLAAFWVQTVIINSFTFVISETKLLLRLPETIHISSFSFENITTGLLARFPITLALPSMAIDAIASLLWRLSEDLSLNSISMSVILNTIEEFLGNPKQELNPFNIDAQAVYGVFYLLSEYDDEYLSTIDTEYLSDLDYSIV